jgi:hypothetical protein
MKGLALGWAVLGIVMSAGLASADLTDGLVGYYQLNGNALDASGNGYNGVNYGATATTDRFGNPTGALRFDGTSSYIDLASLVPALAGGGQGSVSLWVKHGTYSQFGSDSVFTYGTGHYDHGELDLGNIGTNLTNESMSFFFYGPGVAAVDGGYVNGHTFYYDDTWHHVVLEMGNDFNALYVDGVKMPVIYGWSGNATTGNSMWAGMTQFTVGRQINDPVYFTGALDDLRIYNRALSSDEIGQLAASVPEPATLLLLASGLAGVGAMTWRRQQRKSVK